MTGSPYSFVSNASSNMMCAEIGIVFISTFLTFNNLRNRNNPDRRSSNTSARFAGRTGPRRDYIKRLYHNEWMNECIMRNKNIYDAYSIPKYWLQHAEHLLARLVPHGRARIDARDIVRGFRIQTADRLLTFRAHAGRIYAAQCAGNRLIDTRRRAVLGIQFDLLQLTFISRHFFKFHKNFGNFEKLLIVTACATWRAKLAQIA